MENVVIELLPKGQFAPLAQIDIYGIITAAVNLILILSAILFVFNIIFAGIKFVLSAGNKDKSQEATRQILNGFIGITIIFATWAIMGFVSQFFGIDLLHFQIPTLQ